MNILFINGANAKTSRLTATVQYMSDNLRASGVHVSELHVIDLPAEDLILTKFGSEAIVNARKAVAEADVLFVATPVYKGAYSGILKSFLDLLPENALQQKVCVPVAIGGTLAHLLMLEYTLKPVLSILGANTIEHGVFAIDKQVRVTDEGMEMDAQLQQRIDGVLAPYRLLTV